MSRSTGPILAAGTITWANNVLLPSNLNEQADLFTDTVRIGVATGLTAGVLFMLEKGASDLAVSLSWAALVTVLMVRVGSNPTPAERALKLVGGN